MIARFVLSDGTEREIESSYPATEKITVTDKAGETQSWEMQAAQKLQDLAVKKVSTIAREQGIKLAGAALGALGGAMPGGAMPGGAMPGGAMPGGAMPGGLIAAVPGLLSALGLAVPGLSLIMPALGMLSALGLPGFSSPESQQMNQTADLIKGAVEAIQGAIDLQTEVLKGNISDQLEAMQRVQSYRLKIIADKKIKLLEDYRTAVFAYRDNKLQALTNQLNTEKTKILENVTAVRAAAAYKFNSAINSVLLVVDQHVTQMAEENDPAKILYLKKLQDEINEINKLPAPAVLAVQILKDLGYDT